jgi:hypothetical protein
MSDPTLPSSELPPEVVGVLIGYERRISEICFKTLQVEYRVTRSGRFIPRSAERQLALIAAELRRELKGYVRYLEKIQGRAFKPSAVYWLEKAKQVLCSDQSTLESSSEGSSGEAELGADNPAGTPGG